MEFNFSKLFSNSYDLSESVPGFYGVMPNGTIKTFSRGGSDITGSIVARAVGAKIYLLYLACY